MRHRKHLRKYEKNIRENKLPLLFVEPVNKRRTHKMGGGVRNFVISRYPLDNSKRIPDLGNFLVLAFSLNCQINLRF